MYSGSPTFAFELKVHQQMTAAKVIRQLKSLRFIMSLIWLTFIDIEHRFNNIILYSQSGIEHVHVQYKTYKEKIIIKKYTNN